MLTFSAAVICLNPGFFLLSVFLDMLTYWHVLLMILVCTFVLALFRGTWRSALVCISIWGAHLLGAAFPNPYSDQWNAFVGLFLLIALWTALGQVRGLASRSFLLGIMAVSFAGPFFVTQQLCMGRGQGSAADICVLDPCGVTYRHLQCKRTAFTFRYLISLRCQSSTALELQGEHTDCYGG